MLGFLVFFFAFLSKCKESELPFENDDDIENDDEQATLEDDADQDQFDQDDEPLSDDEIKKNEKDIKSSPTPAPAPVKIPIKDLIGKMEYIVAAGMVFSLIFFMIGRRYVSKQVSIAYEAFSPIIRKYFAVMPRNFSEKNYHDYVIYFSGRTGYVGGVCEVHIRRCCDIFGFVFGFLTGDHNTIKFDLLLNPKYKPSGDLTIAKERPLEFHEDLKLKEIPLSHHLKCFTDFGKERHPYLNLINSYMANSKSVEFIEITNGNRFEYSEQSDYVAHFEFRVIGNWNDFINDELIKFVMDLSDKFTSAQFSYEVQSANERVRNKIEKDRNPEPEKQLTKEEEAKLEKRKERREQNKFKPKFKAG